MKTRPPLASRNDPDAVQDPAPGSARVADEAVDFDAAGQNEHKRPPETDALALLLRQFRELSTYFSYYLSAKADSVQLGLRNVLLNLILAAFAFVVVGSVSVMAAWFMLHGMAEGLGVLFGNRPWAGSLLTGSLLAAGLGCGTYCIVMKHKNAARERTVAQYDNKNSRQQIRYGNNVADRAAPNASDQK